MVEEKRVNSGNALKSEACRSPIFLKRHEEKAMSGVREF
jgi:hypothetical protein